MVKDYKHVTWEKLIHKAKKGNQTAITELYNRTYSQGFSVALQMVKNEEDAMDILQNAYISAFNNLHIIREPEKFKNWFNCIVANKCRDFLRKHKDIVFSEMEGEEDVSYEETLESDLIEFSPEQSVDYSETKKLINDILQALPQEQRLCILMYYYNELSVNEIAEALECSENTVKSRLNYARNKIREEVKALEKKGTKLYNVAPIPFIVWMLRGSESMQGGVLPNSLIVQISKEAKKRGLDMIGKKLINFIANIGGKGIVAKITVITVPIILTGGLTMSILLTERGQTKKQSISTVREIDSAEEKESPNESSTDNLVDEEKNSEDTLNIHGGIDKTNDADMDESSQNSNEKTSEKPQNTNTKQESQSTTKPPVKEEATQETRPLIPQEKINEQRIINQGYRDFLMRGGEQGYYEGIIYQFGIIDMNGDGVDELLFYTYEPNKEEDSGPNFMMTYDGEVCGSGQGFGVMSNTEYCVETKHFIETRYYSDGSYDFTINEFEGAYFGPESIILEGEEYMFYFHVDVNGKYSFGGPDNIYYEQKLTDKQVTYIQQKVQEYLPNRTKAIAPHQISAENLNKYLPIDDAGIIEQLRAK